MIYFAPKSKPRKKTLSVDQNQKKINIYFQKSLKRKNTDSLEDNSFNYTHSTETEEIVSGGANIINIPGRNQSESTGLVRRLRQKFELETGGQNH